MRVRRKRGTAAVPQLDYLTEEITHYLNLIVGRGGHGRRRQRLVIYLCGFIYIDWLFILKRFEPPLYSV